MTKFVVDLGDLAVPDHKKRAIAADIQRAVLAHMVDVSGAGGYHNFTPIHWLGLILRERIPELGQAEQQIGKFVAGGP